jgi:tRNA dimethylallyltransferase
MKQHPPFHPEAVICLMGPTASGKTALALEWAQQWPVEIISVDSALIYRGMDIGTAKPTRAEQATVPHHLIDILDPTAHYSAGQFVSDATALIQQIRARGKTPLLVGGTMLYFKALQQGIAELPVEDPIVRADILHQAQTKGWPALHAELMQIDPAFATKVNVNDTQRISRGLEVFYLSGQPLSLLQKQNQRPPDLQFQSFAIIPSDRSLLHQRIEARIDGMLKAGFVEEVITLRQKYPLHPGLPSMRAVGYRQVWAYLEGQITGTDLPQHILFATRQYAKRQLTWLRGWPELIGLSQQP